MEVCDSGRGEENVHVLSRVLEILPAHPISDDKIRTGGYEEQNKVFVVGVLCEDIEQLAIRQQTCKAGEKKRHT